MWLPKLPRQLVMGIICGALVLGAATLCVAQMAGDRQQFYLESVLPTRAQVESIAPQELDQRRPVLPNPNQYNLEFSSGHLLSLRHQFMRNVIEQASSPLGVAIQEKLATEASLALGRTELSFASTTQHTDDLRGLALMSSRTHVMGLRQTLGKGESTSKLSLTRTETEQSTPTLAYTTVTEALEFQSGLTKSSDLLVKASRTNTDQPGALQENAFEAVLKLAFSGGETPWGYRRIHKFNPYQNIVAEKMDFAVPLKISGQPAIAEYHSDFTTTNGKPVGQRSTHVAVPLRMSKQVGLFDYLTTEQNKGQGPIETTTTKLVAPWQIGKQVWQTEGTRIEVSQGGTETETVQLRLTSPLAGGQPLIQHQTVTTKAGTTETEVEQLALTFPPIKLSKFFSLYGQRLTTDVKGTPNNQEVMHFNFVVTPAKPLQMEGQYHIDDRGEGQVAVSTQMQTKWTFDKQTALVGQFRETEAQDGSASTVLRLIEFVRERGKEGLGLRAGLASYGQPGAEVPEAKRMELVWGTPKALAINAAYSEYDPKSWARYPEDEGIVSLSLQHGDPKKLALRWRYEDQPGRVAPLRALEMALPALNGALQLSFATNPLTPDGKAVRQADQYEATLKQQLAKDFNFELGYRYLTYSTKDDIEQNWRIALVGGKEDLSGKLAIAFMSGDFAPKPNPQTPPPGSVFDLSYTRKISDNGRLSIVFKHQTPLSATMGTENIEGRLEFNVAF